LKNLLIELNNEVKSKEDEENNKSFNNSLLKSTDSGTKFSNFKLILPLAKGGYGTVGLYKKISTGDLYTIKSVDINKMKERKLSKTLQNERNIMKEISSDYVVTTYYLFKDKINYYFVMEYLPGGDVYKLLSSIFLPFSTIQLIVAETLLAVNYLHKKNIIHHDIKPENILITKNGHFKLSDFGLSKTINEKGRKLTDEENLIGKSSECSSSSSLKDFDHDDNKIEGTLFYMSPELFTGDFPVGKSIDYWAIGIIIFELFTFKVPFEAGNEDETRQNIINYNINWDPMYSEEVEKHYKDYIDSTVDLIKKFIFFNPNQRWGDNDLEKIKNHDFFKGFDWANIKSIKSTTVLSYLKKIVEENNKKIKEFNKGNGVENYANILCEENLTYDEENNRFSQRIDNLQKRNNELIKMKFKKKEIKIEENDINLKRSLFFDLQ
jgi:serine/threonine protein kinase